LFWGGITIDPRVDLPTVFTSLRLQQPHVFTSQPPGTILCACTNTFFFSFLKLGVRNTSSGNVSLLATPDKSHVSRSTTRPASSLYPGLFPWPPSLNLPRFLQTPPPPADPPRGTTIMNPQFHSCTNPRLDHGGDGLLMSRSL